MARELGKAFQPLNGRYGIVQGVCVLACLLSLIFPKAAHAACVSPAGVEGQLVYNKDYHTPQFCNGTQWVGFSPSLPGAGAGPCASPAGAEGTIIYNDTSKIMQFCNGKDWVAFGAASAADATSNLLAWYKLDSGTGTTAIDSASSPHNGTLTNGPAWVPGFSGYAVNFDGTNDYIDIPYVSAFDLTGDLTLAAWVNAANVTGMHRIVSLPRDGTLGSELYTILIKDGAVQFWLGAVGGADQSVAGGTIATGGWHHIAATVSGRTMLIYIDGQVVAGGVFGVSYTRVAHSTGNLAIGRFSAAYPQIFNGAIDDVRIYDRALSVNDIHAMAGCMQPVGALGAMMYNKDAKTMQYCNGGQWIAAAAPVNAPPTGCNTIGNVCSDGTVYAGLSPDGNARMYTTPADAPLSGSINFTNGTAGAVDTAIVNCTYVSGGSQPSCSTGRDNSAFLAGLGNADSPYRMAAYCESLVAYGHGDWYLPSVKEVQVLEYNAVAIGGFNTSELWPDAYYASSSEVDAANISIVKFESGGSGGWIEDRAKSEYLPFRCVRH